MRKGTVGTWIGRAAPLTLMGGALSGAATIAAAPPPTLSATHATVSWTGGPLTGTEPGIRFIGIAAGVPCQEGTDCGTDQLDVEFPPATPVVVTISVTPDDQAGHLALEADPPGCQAPCSSGDRANAPLVSQGATVTLSQALSGMWSVITSCHLCAQTSYHATATMAPAALPRARLPLSPDPAGLSLSAAQVVSGGFEPRLTAAADGTLWAGTQGPGGAEQVFASHDGGATWLKTPADPPGGSGGCCDNDIVVTRTGRVIASIIVQSSGGPSFDVEYSDDGGKSWTQSSGTQLVDQDRQWFAVGPDDAATHLPTVYMLWHNLFSGPADHEMLVSTSKDNGATFGPPALITTPGDQAWLDLQCADSGGPSNIFVNARSGQVYAVWGTRTSAAGGCGASVLGPFEVNVVAATRAWVATSTDEGSTWTDSLAVDDGATGQVVGMQLQAGAVDSAGNVYVMYPESPNPYPDYDGAAIRYVHAPADLSSWSPPVTVAPSGGPGHLLPYMVAGDAGKLAFFYLRGVESDEEGGPLWYPYSAETLDGLASSPVISEAPAGDVPTWQGTASQLMGVCNALSPAPDLPLLAGVNQGTLCGRSSDVLGMALDGQCRIYDVWYADSTAAGHLQAGTWVSRQSAGAPLGQSCAVAGIAAAVTSATRGSSSAPARSSVHGAHRAAGLPNTSGSRQHAPGVLLLLLPLPLLSAAALRRVSG